jgi:hypothetical protein
MTTYHPIAQSNQQHTANLLRVVLNNIPAARRLDEARRVGARDTLLLRAAS